MVDLSRMGLNFGDDLLERQDLSDDPYQQFESWFQAAVKQYPDAANMMTLATADQSARPSARIVLLKAYDHNGFVFYTNYNSRKGLELATNPQAALLFFWPKCHRQIRIEGKIIKTSAAESDAYFASRPKSSQIGALTSAQSQVIENYTDLTQQFQILTEQYADQATLKRPDHWGGYRLIPSWYEFWQGGYHRLHHRFAYTLQKDGNWLIERLAP